MTKTKAPKAKPTPVLEWSYGTIAGRADRVMTAKLAPFVIEIDFRSDPQESAKGRTLKSFVYSWAVYRPAEGDTYLDPFESVLKGSVRRRLSYDWTPAKIAAEDALLGRIPAYVARERAKLDELEKTAAELIARAQG